MARSSTAPPPIEADRVYKVAEIATLLKTSDHVIRRQIRRGLLPAVRIGREYRVLGSALDLFIKAQTR
jgi:excisionase family DNA binding protein